MSRYYKYIIDLVKDEKNFTDEQKARAIDSLEQKAPERNWAGIKNIPALKRHIQTHGVSEDELLDLLAGDKHDIGHLYMRDALTNWAKEHNKPEIIDKALDKHWNDLVESQDAMDKISEEIADHLLETDEDFKISQERGERKDQIRQKRNDARNAINTLSQHGNLSDKQFDRAISEEGKEHNISGHMKNQNLDPRHLLKMSEKDPENIHRALNHPSMDVDTASRILEKPEVASQLDNNSIGSFIKNKSEGYDWSLKPKADEEQSFGLNPRAIHNILENNNKLSQNTADALLDHADPSFKKKWIDDRLGMSEGSHHDEDLVGTDDNWDNWSRNDFKPEWNSYERSLPSSRHLDDEHAEHIKRHGDFDHKYDLYHNEHIDPKHGVEMFQKWYDDDHHHGYDSEELNQKIKDGNEDLYTVDHLPEDVVEEIREQGYDDGSIDEAAEQRYSMQDYIDENEDKIIDKIIKDGHYDDDVLDLAHEKMHENYDDWEGENPNSSQNEGDPTFDALNTLWELEQDGDLSKEDLKAQTGLEDWSKLGFEANDDGDVHSSEIKDKLDEYGGPLRVNFADHEDLHISEHPEYESRLDDNIRDAVKEHFRENQRDYVDKMYLYEDHREDDSYREALSEEEDDYIQENASEHLAELYDNAHRDPRAIPAHLHAHIPNYEDLHRENKQILMEGPNKSWLDSKIKDRSYEHEYGDNLHHHEMVRDYAQANGGKIDVGTMNKMYPNQKQIWKQIFDNKGKLNSEEIENKIQELPKTKYDLSYGKWGSSKMQNLNRQDQVILRLDHSTDSIKPLMENQGVYDTFKKVQSVSKQSGHPTNNNTIGWARVDTSDPNHWMVDEMQSDFGKTVQRYLKKEGDEHKADHVKTIQEHHKNWRETLMNAVLKEAKKHGAEKVSTHSPESKHAHAAYGSDKIRSVYKKSYKQVPRSMGFQPTSHENLPITDSGRKHFVKEDPYKLDHIDGHQGAYEYHMNMWKAHESLANDADQQPYRERHEINSKGHLDTALKHAERLKTLKPDFEEIDKNKVQPSHGSWVRARDYAENNDFLEHSKDSLLKEPTPEFKDTHNEGHTYDLNPKLIKKNMDEFLELYDRLEKGDGWNAVKGGIISIAALQGMHMMDQNAKEAAANKFAQKDIPTHARTMASIEPSKTVKQMAFEEGQKEANDIIYRNYKKDFLENHSDGLSPHAYKQTIKNNPELNDKYGYVHGLSNNTFKEITQKNGNLRSDVHSAHYDKLHDEFEGDMGKIKHAWKNGINNTKSKFNNQKPVASEIEEEPNFTHRRAFRSGRR